jgi:hypothetical protein
MVGMAINSENRLTYQLRAGYGTLVSWTEKMFGSKFRAVKGWKPKINDPQVPKFTRNALFLFN